MDTCLSSMHPRLPPVRRFTEAIRLKMPHQKVTALRKEADAKAATAAEAEKEAMFEAMVLKVAEL